jgi:Mor family transcriptional regulator
MKYKNGKDFLPPRLLKELQEYIQGELLYIPKKVEQKRARWGENNGTRYLLQARNKEIYNLYLSGVSVGELVKRYHLSEDSIRKIILKTKSEARKTVQIR